MEWLLTPEPWIALVSLTVLEIILGIDNVIFISILAGKLPEEQRPKARFLGLALAMVMRILLLLSISWVMGLTEPLFAVFGHEVSGRDLILLFGGLFLLAKSTHEIHEKLEGEEHSGEVKQLSSFASVLFQIALLDMIFSLDSVITAVGMAEHIPVMVAAIMISIGFMMVFAGPVSEFVERHPTVKMLALSFLLLIGFSLVAEGAHFHIPKGYIYFAMAFAVFVEMLNLRARKSKSKIAPIRLRMKPR